MQQEKSLKRLIDSTFSNLSIIAIDKKKNISAVEKELLKLHNIVIIGYTRIDIKKDDTKFKILCLVQKPFKV